MARAGRHRSRDEAGTVRRINHCRSFPRRPSHTSADCPAEEVHHADAEGGPLVRQSITRSARAHQGRCRASEPRVDVVFVSADMSPDLIDASVNAGAKGIVIAGVGNGNMNKATLDAAARAVKKGVVVVRSSRVATGLVDRNVEVNDDELGFIASDELNPQKSRILLSLALLNQTQPAKLQEMFRTY